MINHPNQGSLGNPGKTLNPFKAHSCRLILILFLVCAFSTLPLHAQSDNLHFESITNENGLTHNTVFDICQDNEGFMWFATDYGLNRYDGKNIRRYYAQDNAASLPSNSVTSLSWAMDSVLFIGTYQGLVQYNRETDNFIPVLKDGTGLGQILDIHAGKKNELLVSTGSKGALLYNFQKKSWIKLNFTTDVLYGMTVDREGTYWAFSRFALYRFNDQGKLIEDFRVFPQLFNSAISCMSSDNRGVLWVGTFEKGLFTFDFHKRKFEPFAFDRNEEMYFVRTIEEGRSPNEYWIGTEKGLYVLNIKSGTLANYIQKFDINEYSINDNAVYKVFKNKEGVFFMGTYFGGVNIASPSAYGFTSVYPDDKPGRLHGKALSQMTFAPDGKLWIATEDAGIAIMDVRTNSVTHLRSEPGNKHTIPTNNVHALLMDGNTCWAGHFMGGLAKIDLNTHQVNQFLNVPNDPGTIKSNFTFSLCKISKDSILVGTVSGVDVFNKITNRFSRFRENELADCFVYDIFTAPDGKIWFLSYNMGVFVWDPTQQGLMKHYQQGDKSGLPGNVLISHLVDSQGRIWLGTKGEGLLRFDPATEHFQVFNDKKLLSNNVVYGIQEDHEKRIWVSSNAGLSRIDFRDSTSVHFTYDSGIAGNQFNYKSSIKDASGKMYFGSVKGLTMFYPEKIKSPLQKPAVYFSKLKIFNDEVVPGESKILKKQINVLSKLKLAYNQNSFTLEYSSVDYYDGDILYEYYLEGFEDKWSPLTHNMQASYTNILPGRYVFHIRAVNQMGNLTGDEKTLIISISHPWWGSWIMRIIYFLLIMTGLYLLYRNYLGRQKEKMALAIEKIENENLNVLHQHKMNFFTYISHEFKTPLSIIIASVEMLLKKNQELHPEIQEIQQTIRRSAMRLLFLINQLMEFRKIESDHENLNVCRGNITEFVNQILNVYRPLLNKKGIELGVRMNYTEMEVYFDFDKLEKIMTNLLTNAIKFTPQEGKIMFDLTVSSNELVFSVSDSGPGMTTEQKGKIFEVFYGEEKHDEMVESSGIGLALTAGLVKFLKGEIEVDTQPELGSKFIVTLPVPAKPVSENENYCPDRNLADMVEMADIVMEEHEEVENEKKDFHIVIAEDNKDLLKLLQGNFKSKYHVKCCENGRDAWRYIQDKTPDLVITDVMMPYMNGTELCSRIKEDINTCHVPVLILTAKANPESRLEGLMKGADAYVSKPFSMEELEIRVENLLKARNVMKVKMSELSRIENLQIPTTNHEQAFVEKIYGIIQEYITNSELNVQFLAEKLNISRSNLHTKLKMLVGMNTTEFINTVRINKAKELLSTEDLTISEVTYKVGYNDSAYFNRIFKKMTGMTPGEFKRSK